MLSYLTNRSLESIEVWDHVHYFFCRLFLPFPQLQPPPPAIITFSIALACSTNIDMLPKQIPSAKKIGLYLFVRTACFLWEQGWSDTLQVCSGCKRPSPGERGLQAWGLLSHYFYVSLGLVCLNYIRNAVVCLPAQTSWRGFLLMASVAETSSCLKR